MNPYIQVQHIFGVALARARSQIFFEQVCCTNKTLASEHPGGGRRSLGTEEHGGLDVSPRRLKHVRGIGKVIANALQTALDQIV